MLEPLFNKFGDLKSEILLNEILNYGYFLMKKFYLKNTFLTVEVGVWRCSIKMVFLEISQNLQENTCARESFFNKKISFIKKNSLAQVFSGEFWEISENTFLQNTSGGCFCSRTSPGDCFWYLKNLTFKLLILNIWIPTRF